MGKVKNWIKYEIKKIGNQKKRKSEEVGKRRK